MFEIDDLSEEDLFAAKKMAQDMINLGHQGKYLCENLPLMPQSDVEDYIGTTAMMFGILGPVLEMMYDTILMTRQANIHP